MIPYKFYTRSTNGRPSVEILPGTNTPYDSTETDFAGALGTLKSGYEKDVASFQEALARGVVGPNNQSAYDAQNYAGKISAIDQAIAKYQSGQLTGQDLLSLPLDNSNPFRNLSAEDLQTIIGGGQVGSGYTTYTNPQTGQQDFITEKSLAELEADKAKANDPNMIPVKVGSGTAYIPKGSAGAALIPSLGQNVTQGATPGSIVTNPSVGAAPQGGTPTASTGLATPAYKDAQNNVYDAQGKHLTMDQLEKGPDGKPKVNLENLPIQNNQGISATPPQFTNNNDGVYKEWNSSTNNWDVKTLDGKAVTLAEFKNMGLNIDHINTKAVVQDQITSGSNQGDGGGTTQPTTNPYQDFQKFYYDTLNASGAGQFMDLYTNFKEQLDENNKELALKVADVNDNPWISEALRQKKVSNLESAYGSISDSLTRSMDLYLGFYNSAKQDAQFQATQAVNMMHDQASLDQQLLLKEMDLAEKQADNARADLADERKYQLDLAGLSIDQKKLALDQYKATQEGTSEGDNYSDLLAQAISSGMSPSEAARDVAAYIDSTVGIPVSQKLLNQLTTQATAIKSQLEAQKTTASTSNPYFSEARAKAGATPNTGLVNLNNLDQYKTIQSNLKEYGSTAAFFEKLF